MASENIIALRIALNGVSQFHSGFRALTSTLAAFRAAVPVAITAAAVHQLVRLTNQAIKTADEMGKLAQKSGIAVDALSSLTFAAHMGDLEQTEFTNALKELGKEMVKQGRDTENLDDRLMELADVFASLPDGARKSQLALDNFGRAGLQMIPFLNQGSEAIRKQREEAAAFGLIINQQFAANADRFNDNLFRIKSSFQGLFLQVAEQILPVFIQLTDQFIEFTKNVETRQAVITGLVEILKRAAIAGFALKFIFGELGQEFFRSKGTQEGETQKGADRLAEFRKMVDLLNGIGEANDQAASSQDGLNKSTKDFVALATKLATLKSVLAVEKGMFDGIGAANIDGTARRRELIENLQTQLRLSREIEVEIQKTAPKTTGEFDGSGALKSEQQIEFETKLLAAKKDRYQIELALRELQADDSFTLRAAANLDALNEKWSNVAVNMADVLTNGVGAAVQGISDGIYGLITGTRTWGQVFSDVARGILKDIIVMVVRWIASMTVMAVLRKAFNKVGAGEASSLAAAWAPAAVAASVASYGVAAGIGGAAYTAALVAGVATTTALSNSGFRSGGYTGDGPPGQIAGTAHRGEFYFSAPQTRRIGVPNLEALASGKGVASPAARSEKPALSVTNILAMDESAVRGIIKSKAGTHEILNVIRMNKHELGLA